MEASTTITKEEASEIIKGLLPSIPDHELIKKVTCRIGPDWFGEEALFVRVRYADSAVPLFRRSHPVVRKFQRAVYNAVLARYPELPLWIEIESESEAKKK